MFAEISVIEEMMKLMHNGLEMFREIMPLFQLRQYDSRWWGAADTAINQASNGGSSFSTCDVGHLVTQSIEIPRIKRYEVLLQASKMTIQSRLPRTRVWVKVQSS